MSRSAFGRAGGEHVTKCFGQKEVGGRGRNTMGRMCACSRWRITCRRGAGGREVQRVTRQRVQHVIDACFAV